MKERSSIVASRLMNLYRQAHVIEGGWRAVNAAFLSEFESESDHNNIFEELKKIPSGGNLVTHIKNLQSGKTPKDSIARELMPYGGMMQTRFDDVARDAVFFSNDDFKSLESALFDFKPTQEYIDKIKSLPFVVQFGDRWLDGVRGALTNHPDMFARWKNVHAAARAFELWERGENILSWPPAERTRAEVQADLPEYETYIPMFGDAGQDLLRRLRAFVSSI